MKRLFSILIVLLFMITGCIFSDDSSDNSDENGGNGTNGDSTTEVNAQNYFPLVEGAEWTYSEDFDDEEIYNTTTTITGTAQFDGKTYYVLQSDADHNMYYRIADNTVYMYIHEDYFQDAGEGGIAIGKKAHVDQFETGYEVPFLDFNKNPGETWTAYSEEYTEEESSISVIITGKYVGTSEASVPAGDFSNCAVFEYTIEIESKYDFQGNSYSSTTTNTETLYFAEDVGIVMEKTISEEQSGSGMVQNRGLIQLSSYNIPE